MTVQLSTKRFFLTKFRRVTETEPINPGTKIPLEFFDPRIFVAAMTAMLAENEQTGITNPVKKEVVVQDPDTVVIRTLALNGEEVERTRTTLRREDINRADIPIGEQPRFGHSKLEWVK